MAKTAADASKKVTEKDAKDKVLEYLRKTNRPYNATDISNNLFQKVSLSKPTLNRVLDNLVKEGHVQIKINGKQSIFVINQETMPAATPQELKEYDTKIAQLKQDISTMKEQNLTLSQELQQLMAYPTNDEMKKQISQLEKECNDYETRLKGLQDSSLRISAQEKDKIENNFNDMVKIWKKRKKLFKDMWNTITEHYQGKPSDLMEELGIETDEMVKVNVDQDYSSW